MAKTVHRRIEGTQSKIQVEVDNEMLVARKIATKAGGEEVRSQVEFLQHIPQELSNHYPKLIDFSLSDENAWYSMEYYAYPTMRWLLLYSSLPQIMLERSLSQVINFLFKIHHLWKREPVPNSYIENTYINRPMKRLRAMEEKAEIFSDLNRSRSIVLGDRVLENPLVLLERLLKSPAVLQKLAPTALVGTHGQVEFEHILVNLSSEGMSEFVLLDPRGVNECLDPAYDAGKILQCTSGKLDWLEEDLFYLGQSAIAERQFTIEPIGLALPNRKKLCDDLDVYARSIILQCCTETSEAFELRMFLAEASHLLSAVPFCYREHDTERAIACYIVGVERLNAFAHRLQI